MCLLPVRIGLLFILLENLPRLPALKGLCLSLPDSGPILPLPNGFDLSQLIELDVVNGSSQAVLSADTSLPTSLKYMVKRDLSANGLSVVATATDGRTGTFEQFKVPSAMVTITDDVRTPIGG